MKSCFDFASKRDGWKDVFTNSLDDGGSLFLQDYKGFEISEELKKQTKKNVFLQVCEQKIKLFPSRTKNSFGNQYISKQSKTKQFPAT